MMKKNILCFFRAGLGDFYLSFPDGSGAPVETPSNIVRD